MPESNHITIKAGAVGAIIVAAGKGSRMGLGYNKVFADLCGRPVLDHTISAFAASKLVGTLVLVISPDDEEKAATSVCLIIKSLTLSWPMEEQNVSSVFNGLKVFPENGWCLFMTEPGHLSTERS